MKVPVFLRRKEEEWKAEVNPDTGDEEEKTKKKKKNPAFKYHYCYSYTNIRVRNCAAKSTVVLQPAEMCVFNPQ